MKDFKRELETIVLESRLKALINEVGQYHCINEKGELNDHFKLYFLIRNHNPTLVEHNKLITAFFELKKREEYIKLSNQRVSKTTLDSFILLNDMLVRPFKRKEGYDMEYHQGEIIKMPVRDIEHNEGWKELIGTERRLSVGDKVLYPSETSIRLDGEILHLVSWVTAKFIKL